MKRIARWAGASAAGLLTALFLLPAHPAAAAAAGILKDAICWE